MMTWSIDDIDPAAAAAVNFAPTDVAALMVTLHVDVPLHPPDHPPNVAFEAGAAVNVTTVPAENEAAQVVPQLMPEGLLVMLPPPVPEVVTVS
jgi:hypothetical protein